MLCSWNIYLLSYLLFITFILISIVFQCLGAFIKFLLINESPCIPDKTAGNERSIPEINLKFKIKIYLWVRRATVALNPHQRLNSLPTWMKYLKSLLNLRSLFKIFKEFWSKFRIERKGFDQFSIALYIFDELLHITFWIKFISKFHKATWNESSAIFIK